MFRNRITSTGSSLLQTTKWMAAIALVAVVFISCKKDKDDKDDGNGRKISEVVPSQYLATVTGNGMPIYEGDTPPNIEGKFRMTPYRFDYDNYSQPGVYPQPGQIMSDLIIEFKQQQGQELSVAFGGGYLTGIELESPFVTGSGNNFTACFQAHMFGGTSALFQFPFAYLFSGKVEGDVIKDLKMARVGLGEANEYGYTVAGNVALYSDSDGSSERTP